MGIRINGETPEIIASCAEVMRTHATPIVCNDPNAIDIVGTGGDCSNAFNISTTAAFVIAGAGVTDGETWFLWSVKSLRKRQRT